MCAKLDQHVIEFFTLTFGGILYPALNGLMILVSIECCYVILFSVLNFFEQALIGSRYLRISTFTLTKDLAD